MTRAPINPDLLRWARERAGKEQEELAHRFPKLPEWEAGKGQPTLKQLEAFAKAVHVPVGYLFLPEPPEESVPLPDFRTFAGQAVRRPSPELLDTIYTCQERQSWYRDFVRIAGEPKLNFVGSATVAVPAETVAKDMRAKLGFDLEARRTCPTWTDALRLFIRQAEAAGVLVMASSIVRTNTHRRLDPGEFRGFALSDPLAPLVFVNGADTKAAQMFTLAHELAHLWLGASALTNLGIVPAAGFRREEVWCNAVAAELLAPLPAVRSELQADEPLEDTLARLARTFKVSTLVILRRLLDAQWIGRDTFDAAWDEELARLRELARQQERARKEAGGGADFYRTTLSRVSRRFARALVVSTLEGQTLYRDAYRMLGVSKNETFEKLAHEVGVSG